VAQLKLKGHYDVVLAGAGPTACILAKDLAKRGKDVIVLERGDDSRAFYGSPLAMICGKHTQNSFPKSMYGVLTEDGDEIVIGKGIGGGTKLYGGLCVMPDLDMWRKWGVDLEPYLEEAKKDTWATEIPIEFLGIRGNRPLAAFAKLGFDLQPMMKHINFNKCKVGCHTCTYGCPRGAKWEGMYALREAMGYGCDVLVHTTVERAIIENGRAVGFKALHKGEPIEVRAEVPVVACGGHGSVPIAKRAGIEDAGSWFTGDPCAYVYGFSPYKELKDKRATQGAQFYNDHVFLLLGGGKGDFVLWFVMAMQKQGFGQALRDAFKFGGVMQLGFKIHDEEGGYVREDGSMRKVYTEQDKERLDYVFNLFEKVLETAGCEPNNFRRSGIILGHPSGTVPIGRLLDVYGESLDVPNLYFCDASVFPEAVGIPPVLTLACYAKYFANHLLTDVLQRGQPVSVSLGEKRDHEVVFGGDGREKVKPLN
jgi:choline dehydrogenase-like flavoprotein